MSNILEAVGWLHEEVMFTTEEASRLRLLEAYEYANRCSPDPSTKNGAVLMGLDGKTLAHGVNKFPEGIAETESRLADKKTKYRLVVHAENGAIFNAAKHGERVDGATMYCPFYACSECAKAIIQSGVKRIVGHAQLMALASEHTVWVKSIVDAWDVLHEAGVDCVLYDGTVGITTRFNGQDILV